MLDRSDIERSEMDIIWVSFIVLQKSILILKNIQRISPKVARF